MDPLEPFYPKLTKAYELSFMIRPQRFGRKLELPTMVVRAWLSPLPLNCIFFFLFSFYYSSSPFPFLFLVLIILLLLFFSFFSSPFSFRVGVTTHNQIHNKKENSTKRELPHFCSCRWSPRTKKQGQGGELPAPSSLLGYYKHRGLLCQ